MRLSLLRRGVAILAVALVLWLPLDAGAQSSQFGDTLRNSPKILQAFKPAVSRPSQSTVRIRCDGKDAALGAVVESGGWILTKYSELSGDKITVKLRNGAEFPAKIVGVHDPYDLALLKIDATGLQPVEWAEPKAAKVGRWVASVGMGDEPVGVGIISVATRNYKAGDQPPKNLGTNSGFLGVGLDEGEGGAKVVQVSPKSPAEKAGIKVNDVVTNISGKKIVDSESMINAIQKHHPGDEITIHLRRGEEEMEVKARLAKRPAFLLGNPQERMGSALSNRRGGFPSILQHDTVVKPTDCGGPLVDLDGKVVGINICRAGRTESYAVPVDAIRRLLPELKSGKLAPRPE
jgi:serine protease Do